MTTERDALIAARALIESPMNWTTGAFARDVNGKPLDVDSDKAVCFCALGAIWRACHDNNGPKTREIQEIVHRAAKEVTGDSSILLVNDFGTHAEVLKVFDRAIELAGE